MTDPGPLEPVDEGWATGLALVAHPDDLEYGVASAVARWTSQGKRIVYALATSGEAGIDAIPPEECGPLREDEERTGAERVGVATVEFLGHADGMLEYGLDLRRDIARTVRRHQPDVVITSNYHDSWGPGRPNQADHIVLGRAVLDGTRDAANRWVFRELLDEDLPPHKARLLLVGNSPQATHGVDVTDHLDAGVASLEAHAQYLAGLGEGGMTDPREFLESHARPAGEQLGTRFAVPFEVIEL